MYPEATLIDIKRINRTRQSIISRKLNYSELFDIKYSYKLPLDYFEFSCSEKPRYTLTSTMGKTGFRTIYYNTNLREKMIGLTTHPDLKTDIRPVFKYSDIKENCEVVEELAPGYLLVTFGMYPNKLDTSIKKKYKSLWQRIKTTRTGNKFTLVDIDDGNPIATEYPEILFDGFKGSYVIKDESIYKVEPVYFLVDVKKDFAISRDILFNLPTLADARSVASYKETLPYEFLNKYFVPELMQNIMREKEENEIEREEIPKIKELIDSIILSSGVSILEQTIKSELQTLINEYNSYIENKKEEEESAITLELTTLSSDELFIKKFEGLLSKITSFPYYEDSKIIYECLNLNIEDNKEIASELYKDLFKIFKFILPTLPENLQLSYQVKTKEVLEYAKNLIIESYKIQNKKEMNIELIVREKLQPILESLYHDVTKNYIAINLNEIVEGIYKSNKDKYLAYFFELINEEVKNIEILISLTKKAEYTEELKQILILDNENNTIENLIKIYLKLLKLKERLEQLDIKRNNLERKKIKRRIV